VILPPIAPREREVFADVVVLCLKCDLHDRREIHDAVCGGEVDVDGAGRQIDRVRLMAHIDLEVSARPEDHIQPRDEGGAYGRGTGVGRGRDIGVALGVKVGVAVGLGVIVAVAVAVAAGLEEGVAVGVGAPGCPQYLPPVSR